MKITERYIKTNGIHLNVAEAGPKDGPLLLLLHGFPEFWYGWRHQISAFAKAGYHVMAPDQRGYNRSDKPSGVAAYAIDTLTDDMVGLIDARALVVGHDWGGGVAWNLAARHPDRVEKLVILNCPHAKAMQHHLRTDPRQMLRSWYILFFQLRGVPEKLLAARDFAWLKASLRSTSRRGTFTKEDLERYVKAWSQPGALTSMINWYRAAGRSLVKGRGSRIQVPTLILWGEHDTALRAPMAIESQQECADARLEFFEGATHWVQHEEAARVNRAILRFFSKVVRPKASPKGSQKESNAA